MKFLLLEFAAVFACLSTAIQAGRRKTPKGTKRRGIKGERKEPSSSYLKKETLYEKKEDLNYFSKSSNFDKSKIQPKETNRYLNSNFDNYNQNENDNQIYALNENVYDENNNWNFYNQNPDMSQRNQIYDDEEEVYNASFQEHFEQQDPFHSDIYQEIPMENDYSVDQLQYDRNFQQLQYEQKLQPNVFQPQNQEFSFVNNSNIEQPYENMPIENNQDDWKDMEMNSEQLEAYIKNLQEEQANNVEMPLQQENSFYQENNQAREQFEEKHHAENWKNGYFYNQQPMPYRPILENQEQANIFEMPLQQGNEVYQENNEALEQMSEESKAEEWKDEYFYDPQLQRYIPILENQEQQNFQPQQNVYEPIFNANQQDAGHNPHQNASNDLLDDIGNYVYEDEDIFDKIAQNDNAQNNLIYQEQYDNAQNNLIYQEQNNIANKPLVQQNFQVHPQQNDQNEDETDCVICYEKNSNHPMLEFHEGKDAKHYLHYRCLWQSIEFVSFTQNVFLVKCSCQRVVEFNNLTHHLQGNPDLQNVLNFENYHGRLKVDDEKWWKETLTSNKGRIGTPKEIVQKLLTMSTEAQANAIISEIFEADIDFFKIVMVLDGTLNNAAMSFTKWISLCVNKAFTIIEARFDTGFDLCERTALNLLRFAFYAKNEVGIALCTFVLFAIKIPKSELKAAYQAIPNIDTLVNRFALDSQFQYMSLIIKERIEIFRAK